MEPIFKYFAGEKQESYLFLALGVAGLAFALYSLYSHKTPFMRGVVLPIIFVSLLEVVVGITLVRRTPQDIDRVSHQFYQDRSLIHKQEVPRMERVMHNFLVFRYIEISLILVGIFLMYVPKSYPLWNGVGVGLLLQASLVLLLDFFAERRGEIYLTYLRSIG